MNARSKVAALAAVALLASVVSVPHAAATHGGELTVQVGTPLFMSPAGGGSPADGMRFYAPTLQVHRGDTVTFDMQGFHTATLLPANTDVVSWTAANSGGRDKPWSFLLSDPDDGSTKINVDVLAASDTSCGSAANPCSYDGSLLNGGAFDVTDLESQEYSFSATIDANPGDVIWVVCLIHPHMRLRIEVVNPADTPTTQQQIDDFFEAKALQDADAANAMHQKLLKKRSFHFTANGRKIWDAYPGFDNKNWALLDMYPKKLVVRKGDRVRYHFDQLFHEDHTATFPLKKGLNIANRSFFPVCDPDGDGGAGPDTDADFTATSAEDLCPSFDQLELDNDPRLIPPAGDGRLTSKRDFESSGVLGAANVVGDQEPWTLRFTKPSGKKPFRYVCMIHPFMRGRVVVKPS